MVAEAEADRLEQRAPEVAGAVGEGEAGEDAARRGVVDRRLLAEEVGQGEQAPRCRRDRLGQPVELGVGRAPAAAQLAHEPVQERARAAMQPFGMNRPGMMWAVEEQPRIGPGARWRAGSRRRRRT